MPAFAFAGELLYQSSPRQRDIRMTDVHEGAGEWIDDGTVLIEGNKGTNHIALFNLDDETIEDDTATGIEGSQGISQIAPPNPRQKTRPALDPGSAQRSNTAEAERNIEEDLNDDSSSISSENEVREVMGGMKSWTETLPFPNDAEDLFPMETHRRRQRGRWKSRLSRLLGSAFGGEGGIDSLSATGRPAPERLLPIPQSLMGEGEDEDEGAETQWGADEAFGNIDGQLKALKEAIRIEASTINGPRGRCVPYMIHHSDCVYKVSARICDGCLSREERCVLFVEEQ